MPKNWKGGTTMFHYDWAVMALIVAALLGVVFPLLGGTVVHKRLSSSGDALAHSSLAGVAIGLVAGFSPLYMAIICCVVSFLLIGLLRRKFGKHAEIGVAVILSASVAIAGVLSGYAKAANFESYLFGSIFLIGTPELVSVIILAVVSVAFFILTYYRQFHALYSEQEASIAHIHVRTLDFFHSLLFALCVAIGAKIVGSLIVSSMIVLPTAAAMLLKRGYRFTVIVGLVISVATMIGGVVISYYADWRPGATSVLLAVGVLSLILAYRGIVALTQRIKKS